MPIGIGPPGLVHPSLPPRQSPAPGVGYDYGAELGNCAGGSFPRKNGQRYRPHLDLNQRPRDLYPPLDEPTMRGRGGPSAGCAPRAVTPDPIARRAEVESLLE